jgi:hypothetical protein
MPNYPVPYQNNWGYSNVGQQMYPQYQQSMGMQQQPAQQQAQVSTMGLKWVDGEVGAKAFQMPAGWPANTPIDLWDTNDTVIYLKSINPMGMPNPLQKARYTLEGGNTGEKREGYSGDTKPDMSEYVRKDDMERMKQELMDAIGNMGSPAPVKKTTAKGE